MCPSQLGKNVSRFITVWLVMASHPISKDFVRHTTIPLPVSGIYMFPYLYQLSTRILWPSSETYAQARHVSAPLQQLHEQAALQRAMLPETGDAASHSLH